MKLIIDEDKKKTKLPKVMKAAIKLFNKKGIDGTTIKDIARAADVSEGALYRHFKGKDELAWHIFTTNLHEFSLNLSKYIEQEKTSLDKIRAFVSFCFESFEKEKDLFTYLILSEHRELDKFPDSNIHPGHVAMKIVEDGQKTGELKKMDVFIAGSIIVGSLVRICIVKICGRLEKELNNYKEEVAISIWKALKND